jgi:hypothetical protein
VLHHPTESTQIKRLPFNQTPLIGRQRELQQLDETISIHPSPFIVIQGAVGVGKTALLCHWIANLWMRGDFEYLGYGLDDLKPTERIPLIWIDNADCLNTCQQSCLVKLQALSQQLPSVHILLTTRTRLVHLSNQVDYELKPLPFHEFSRYVRYLGLPYASIHIRLLHSTLQGNLNGLTLLNSLPIYLTRESFLKQLAIVQRYAQAQQRQASDSSCSILTGILMVRSQKGIAY